MERFAEGWPVLDPLGLGIDFREADLDVLGPCGTRPQRAKSRLRSPALLSKRTIGSWSVGAAFQLGAKFGVGRCGGIEKTRLISLTSEERRTRPHMGRKMGSLIEGAHATSRWPHGRSLNHLVGTQAATAARSGQGHWRFSD